MRQGTSSSRGGRAARRVSALQETFSLLTGEAATGLDRGK